MPIARRMPTTTESAKPARVLSNVIQAFTRNKFGWEINVTTMVEGAGSTRGEGEKMATPASHSAIRHRNTTVIGGFDRKLQQCRIFTSIPPHDAGRHVLRRSGESACCRP